MTVTTILGTRKTTYLGTGLVVWFTGLSSAGKTTIAEATQIQLAANGLRVEVLDGDVVRKTLSKDLGFTREDRDENIRRVAFVASLLVRHGIVVLVAAISPFRQTRECVRNMFDNFVEVYVNAPLNVCEQRDVKGLYKRAHRGEICHVTGIDDPYEPPLNADVECCTAVESVSESVSKVLEAIKQCLKNND